MLKGPTVGHGPPEIGTRGRRNEHADISVVCRLDDTWGGFYNRSTEREEMKTLLVLALLCAKPPEIWTVTAYCPGECCCQGFADGITASGHRIKHGDKFVAAPKNIPFGTMITIPGYGRVPVLGRGGAIKTGRLDVFFDDANGVSGHQRALNWGVKYFEVVE